MTSSSFYSDRQFKQAIEWFVRLQSDQCPPDEHRKFESWLAKHNSHRMAYAEAERVWATMDSLRMMQVPGLTEARAANLRKSTFTQLSSWLFVLMTTATMGLLWSEYNAETLYYQTQIGEHRHIVLADNSQIDLNTNSQVAVKISLLLRHVELTHGEALFDVSHNRLRPFTVQVGDLQIRDIGTRFNVMKNASGAVVSVLEGKVELNNGYSVVAEPLLAGSQRSYNEAVGLSQLQSVDAEKLSAWVNGKLVFKQTPLREVTAELQRYHPVQFNFADAKLGQETLSGTFNSDDINPFLHAIEQILPVQTKRNGEQILLRRAPRK
jgi:transmembrane sensor